MPTAALVGDVDAAPLRAAGWEVRGRLRTSPFDGPLLDAVGYLEAGELLEDDRVDLAVVDGAAPTLAALLPELRAAGLLVLLPGPAPLDVDAVREARAVDGPATAVGLAERFAPWVRSAAAAASLAGAPAVQVTVRGWPRGPGAAAELVDVVGLWCGEVVAAVAAPGPLPAAALPGGEPVSWALLTAPGTTVLVAHGDGRPRARLSFPSARLDAGPDGVRWEAGADVPLLPPPDWLPAAPRGTAPGPFAAAAGLRGARGDGDLPPVDPPADLGDLLVAAQVLAALRRSARLERLVPVA